MFVVMYVEYCIFSRSYLKLANFDLNLLMTVCFRRVLLLVNVQLRVAGPCLGMAAARTVIGCVWFGV